MVKNTYEAVTGGRSGAPPEVRAFMQKHGNEAVVRLNVCRKPIESTVKKIANIVTLGALEKAMKKLKYEDVFHLYLFVTIKGEGAESTWRFEKNHVLSLKPSREGTVGQCATVPYPGSKGELTIGQLFSNAVEARGPDLFRYDAVTANCQDFVRTVLSASGMLSPALDSFITQNAAALLPSFVRGPAKALTDLAARADVALHGRGF